MTWTETRLKHLADAPIVNGLGEAATLEDETWPRYIRTTDFSGPRELHGSTLATLPPDVAARAPVRRGDLLMSAAGTVGKTYLHLSDEPACFAGYLVRFRPKSDVDPRFIAYWTETPLFLDQVEVGKVTSTIDNFSAGKYQNLRLHIPYPQQQRAIADFLDTETARIDALIAKKRRMIDLLRAELAERVARAVLLEQRYDHPLQVTRGEALVPGVRAMRLSWIATFGSGTTPEAGSERYYGGDIPWVLTGDLRDGDVHETTRSVTAEALADYSALKVHPAGSLIVAMYGATIGKMGVLRIAAAVNQACCVIAPGPDLDTDFLYLYLFGFRKELIELGRGSGQPNISQEILRSLRLAVPPVELQRGVVADLRRSWARAERTAAALERQISLLQEHRQALITAAVTGELEVPGVAV